MIYKFISICFIFCFWAVTVCIGQEPTPVTVKRNSPFAPNPKKKSDNIAAQPKTVTDISQSDSLPKIVKVESVTNVQTEEKNTSELPVATANDSLQVQDFESRSAAKKTLEVAKKAVNTELAPTEIYKVGMGDVLFISLQNAPAKETTYFTVLNDGNIDYPLAGEMVQVLGLTTEQIEETLESKIKLYENPQISVKVRQHNSHTYTVIGLVEKTGEKQMPREALPLFVVKAESIIDPKANQFSLIRGNQEKKVFELNDPSTVDFLIYPGDIIEFSAREAIASQENTERFYFIGGEINSGGRKILSKGLTLTQAVIESGGLKKPNVKKVVIRRKNEAGLLNSLTFDLKNIKDGKAIDPILEPGDTIEIGIL